MGRRTGGGLDGYADMLPLFFTLLLCVFLTVLCFFIAIMDLLLSLYLVLLRCLLHNGVGPLLRLIHLHSRLLESHHLLLLDQFLLVLHHLKHLWVLSSSQHVSKLIYGLDGRYDWWLWVIGISN